MRISDLAGMWVAAMGLAVASCASDGQAPAVNKVIVPPKGYASIEVLWPGVAPGAVGTESDDVPKLYCYPAPGDGVHSAVVLLPGGGYTSLVMEHEGADEARWLNQHGVSAYVLEYRLGPRYEYPWPLVDGERAVRFVRSHAKVWKLRPDAIGVWGFSAGGHMAGYLATAKAHGEPEGGPSAKAEAWAQEEVRKEDAVDAVSAHPDFAIISYGRLVLDASVPGSFGMATLLGKDAPKDLIDSVSPVLHVTKDSSPSMIYATEMDEKVDAENATLFFNALRRAGVPAELHVFERGPHGTHMGMDKAEFPELGVFPVLLENWMKVGGWMSPQAEPVQ
jgi:acetyl esterase/lipase